jgi:hypothetical protein
MALSSFLKPYPVEGDFIPLNIGPGLTAALESEPARRDARRPWNIRRAERARMGGSLKGAPEPCLILQGGESGL